MRKIETQLLAAIRTGASFKGSNTTYDPSSGSVRLHGNLIAKRDDRGIWGFTLAGWNTPTTRSRVSALLRELRPNSRGVGTKKGQALYYNGADTLPVADGEWF